jgi:serine/threonine protein kinase
LKEITMQNIQHSMPQASASVGVPTKPSEPLPARLENTLVDGRYLLRREIACGGMGTIYEAENVALGEVVALKLLNESLRTHPAIIERLRLEARILSQLRHPNIVSVRDMGDCPVVGPYVVLELLNGRPLNGLLTTRRRLTVEETVWLGVGVAQALSRAHNKNIIHRDLKPGNIFIAREPGTNREHPVLLDFGIAFNSTGETAARRITHQGEIVGTPEYLPPEILLENAPPSPTTDIFTLAVVLYECLSGDVPFPGTLTAVTTAWSRNERPALLSIARPDVPMPVERVILSALSRDISQRPATAADFADRLVRALGYKPDGQSILHGIAAQMETQGVSRRVHPRVGYLAPLRITAPDGSYDGHTEDISEGGALVVGGRRPPDGTEVTVRFPLPISGGITAVQARTKWCRSRRGTHAVGIEFMNLTAGARAEIARYVAALSVANAS